MDVAAFDYELPEERIALEPLADRLSARLLELDASGSVFHHTIADLPQRLSPGDALVINDTKVIPAQLYGKRGDVDVAITLHSQEGPVRWRAFAKPGKRLRPGDEVIFPNGKASVATKHESGDVSLVFDCPPEGMMSWLHAHGSMPLPPYIAKRRAPNQQDKADYQTVYAAREGAVAAPTAGLHLTDNLLDEINSRGIEIITTTLHVGAGTFLPVKAKTVEEHKMHAEWGEITPAAAHRLNEIREQGGLIAAVGTTSLRVMESAVDAAGIFHPFQSETSIFITPGYAVRSADRLLTNFHLPKSTLLMLVSAFSGFDAIMAAYQEAIRRNYRFFSYGDACWLHRVPSETQTP
ncbi:MAG: tRNA preQ1(34) S-adenosylmethionine ribosyltransferase-isomerase QueA [Pseudomonadota bacterium]